MSAVRHNKNEQRTKYRTAESDSTKKKKKLLSHHILITQWLCNLFCVRSVEVLTNTNSAFGTAETATQKQKTNAKQSEMVSLAVRVDVVRKTNTTQRVRIDDIKWCGSCVSDHQFIKHQRQLMRTQGTPSGRQPVFSQRALIHPKLCSLMLIYAKR